MPFKYKNTIYIKMARPGKGGKKKTRGKKIRIRKNRNLILKDKSSEGSQLYGVVSKRLGGKPAYILVTCEDGVDRKCVVRGKFTKKVWMNPDDIVLINYNKDNDNLKGEIETKYSPQEVSKLKRMGELFALKLKNNEQNEDDNIVFGNGEEEINDTSQTNDNKQKSKNSEGFGFKDFEDLSDDDDFDFDAL